MYVHVDDMEQVTWSASGSATVSWPLTGSEDEAVKLKRPREHRTPRSRRTWAWAATLLPSEYRDANTVTSPALPPPAPHTLPQPP